MISFITTVENTNKTFYINPAYVISAVDDATSITILLDTKEFSRMTFPANNTNLNSLNELVKAIKNLGSRYMS